MYKLFFLILFSVSSLLALPPSYAKSRIAIGSNPADFTIIHNGENAPSAWMISLIEEELTNSPTLTNCSYILVDTENPEVMKKYREVIEEARQYDQNDPRFLPKANFITATHLLKGKGIINHECAMVNLRIEDRKGCIRAQKKISVRRGVRNLDDLSNLVVKAARSLHYQLCDPKFNEQTCSKSHYSDKLACSSYFVITTKIERKEESRKDRGANTMVNGSNSLLSSWTTTKTSKQIIRVTSNGRIKMMALKDDAHSNKHGSFYKFNGNNCSYETKSKTSKDKNLNYSMASLKHHNIGLADDDKAIIEFVVRDSPFKKKFSVNWRTLQKSGSWSGHGSYHKSKSGGDLDVPEGLEGLSGISNQIKGLLKATREELGPKSKEMVQMGIDNFGRSQKENCHQKRVHEGLFVDEKKTSSINIDVDISIRKATKSEIDLMKNISDNEDIRTYRARNIKQSKFEKEPQSIFDSLQNSAYTDMSQRDKKAWDKADKEHKKAIQNKKNLEEFDGMTIDDLEMFTK